MSSRRDMRSRRFNWRSVSIGIGAVRGKVRLVVFGPAFDHRIVLVDGDLLGLAQVGKQYGS
jgi:hypothetical protein